MSKLYNDLAEVYHEMYQGIFDYKKEYEFYNNILKNNNVKSIAEVGCGSGNLANYFVDAGYNYTGVDLSQNMLKIAVSNNPEVDFVNQDMRDLDLKKPVDAVIISGRSFTYMIRNIDGMNCIKSVANNLNKGGMLIFDNFSAQKMFTNFSNEFVQESKVGDKTYKRYSVSKTDLQTGWTWNLEEKYSVIIDNEETYIGEDKSTIRAYTEDEIELFLEFNNLEFIEHIPQEVSFVTVARRV